MFSLIIDGDVNNAMKILKKMNLHESLMGAYIILSQEAAKLN